MKKRILAMLLIICNMISVSVFAEDYSIDSIIESISTEYMNSATEWAIMDMISAEKKELLDSDVVQSYVDSAILKLSTTNKLTDFDKTAIIFTALGLNPTKVSGTDGEVINIIDIISDSQSIGGINGAVFSLLAYDSGDYTVEDKTWTRQSIINYIKENQHDDGGWSLSNDKTQNSDPDITSIAVSALSPYYLDDSDIYSVKETVDSAILCMSQMQQEDGQYASFGTNNSNSAAMIIVALCSLGIDAKTDNRFVKSDVSVLDALLTYKTQNDRFGYSDNITENRMSTEQCFRALIAYDKFCRTSSPFNIYKFPKQEENSKTVSIRIEGISENKLYEKEAEVSDNIVTVADLVKYFVPETEYVYQEGQYGGYFSSIFGEQESTFGGTDYDGWQYRVNGQTPMYTMGQYNIEDGDDILIYYGGMSIAYPDDVKKETVSGALKLTFTYEKTTYGPAPDYTLNTTQEPIAQAKVTWHYGEDNSAEYTTNDAGEVLISYDKATIGNHVVQIEKYGDTEVDGKYLPQIVRYADDYIVNIDNIINKPDTSTGGGGGSSNITVSFTLIGDSKHTSVEKHEAFETWIQKTNISVPVNSSIKTVFEKVLKASGIEYTIKDDGYISSIKGLSEFDNGPNSGWMYSVNNKLVNVGMKEFVLKNNDNIVWYYTDDYTKENDSFNSGLNGNNSSVTSKPNSTGSASISVQNPVKEDTYTEVKFSDVPENHWAKDYIYKLVKDKIINGKSENIFAPDDFITRAEFVTLLYKASGNENKSTDILFDDINNNDWYFNAVSWALDAEITNGISEKSFAPDENITREQMATILARFSKYMQYPLINAAEQTDFSDNSEISDWAKSSVALMQKAKIISGKDNNIFAPNDNATRAEAAKMLCGLLEFKE